MVTLRLFDGYDRHMDTRDYVRQLQDLLTDNGFPTMTDGRFGPGTQEAVMAFQKARGLEDDGIVGPITWSNLFGKPSAPTTYDSTYAENNVSLLAQSRISEKYYAEFIREGAVRAGFPVAVIFGVGSRESGWGYALTPPVPSGTGDFIARATRRPWRHGSLPNNGEGFGKGLMQIDLDAHEFARSGNWRDPYQNIMYGCGVLKGNFRYMSTKFPALNTERLQRAAIAAYNCGPKNVETAIESGRSIDFFTHGRDYSRDVLSRAGWFQLHGWK